MPDSATQQLARFIAASHWSELPEAVQEEGRRSLLNVVGCALGAAHDASIDAAMQVVSPLSGADRVTVIGRSERLDMLSAAFVNAISGNLHDYDDTHLRTVIHPSATVAAAALALAERDGLSGRDLLHAFILGAEVECRIGNAVSPGHYARGWHITATCGVFGAAAASARVLRLSAEHAAHALGIAASQSSGLVENLSSAAKNVAVGNAARNGVFAALLAQRGYAAAPEAIEGRFGWARAMGDAPILAEMTDGLGARWELLHNTYKPYPCGIVMHAVIDACLQLRRDHALTASDVAEIIISGDQLLLDRGDRIVNNERDARVSIHHCAAVPFLFGAAGLPEFAGPAVHDPDVVALRARTSVRLDEHSPRGAATAIVRTKGGRELTATVLHAKGSAEHPMGNAEIEAKLRGLAAFARFGGDVDGLIDAVWNLPSAPSVTGLTASLRG